MSSMTKMRRRIRGMELYCWCMHCNRAWRSIQWLTHKGCPARDCNAFASDKVPWSAILKYVPSYPNVPVLGRTYWVDVSWSSRRGSAVREA